MQRSPRGSRFADYVPDQTNGPCAVQRSTIRRERTIPTSLYGSCLRGILSMRLPCELNVTRQRRGLCFAASAPLA